jgi:hypothetical protein
VPIIPVQGVKPLERESRRRVDVRVEKDSWLKVKK